MSDDRLDEELGMLTAWYPELEYHEEGRWVLIPRYSLPDGIWATEGHVEICFQIPEQFPGQAPYGFYVRPDLQLAGGQRPSNYEYPAQTTFGEGWGKFSWSPESWQPAADAAAGSNLLEFARSFATRLREGA